MSDAAADIKHWLLRDLPYAAMLAFALGGLVLTSFRGAATYYYWMAMAPIYALIVIASGWRQLETGGERFQHADWWTSVHYSSSLHAAVSSATISRKRLVTRFLAATTRGVFSIATATD